MDTTIITTMIDNQKYVIDFDRAKELGLVKPLNQPIKFNDLKNGDVVKFKSETAKRWSNHIYVMRDVVKETVGQCLLINRDESYITMCPTYFRKDMDTQFSVLQDDGSWKDSISI